MPASGEADLRAPAAALAMPAADSSDAATAGVSVTRVRQLIAGSQEAGRAMLEAEEALGLLREQFERTEDAAVREQLALEALDHVERELTLARGRRRQLDGIEGTLWARRNRLARFLIHARGRAWWRARGKAGSGG